MKRLTYLIALCFAFIAVSNTIYAEVVPDPFAHYLTTYQNAYSTNDEVLSFVVDFDKDTRVLFISLMSLVDGKAGNIWLSYAQTQNGYEPLKQPVSLRKDALAFTALEGLQGDGLITYWPISAARGTLRAIQIEAGKILDHNLGQIEPLDKDKDLYTSLFHNDAIKVAVEERPVTEVLAASVPHDIPSNEHSREIQPRRGANINPKASSAPPQIIGKDMLQSDSEKDILLTIGKPWISYALIAVVFGVLLWVGFAKFRVTR